MSAAADPVPGGSAFGSPGSDFASPGGGSAAVGLPPPGSAGPAPPVNFLKPAAVKETASPLAKEFQSAKSYKALYERLKDSPEGRTPEGQYYLYQMLRACATVAEFIWMSRGTEMAH